MNTDVIIIGGGAIGAACAFECAKAGLQVALIDKRACGSGASGASAAMLELQIDAHRREPFYSFAKHSRFLFPALHQELLDTVNVDIQYEAKGIVQLAFNDDDKNFLEQETKRQQTLGLRARYLETDDLQNFLPLLNPIHCGGALFEDDGQVNGELLTSGLIKAAQYHGATIVEHAGDIQWIIENKTAHAVQTQQHVYRASHIVVAAGAWTDEVLKPLGAHCGIEPIRGQLVYYDTPNRLFDTPIYTRSHGYITPKPSGYTLAGTTVEKTGFDESTTEKGKIDIHQLAINLIPGLGRKAVRGQSAGLRPGSVDQLPVIGSLSKHPQILVAAGHYRNGILLAPATGQVVANIIMKKPLAVDTTSFTPERIKQPALS